MVKLDNRQQKQLGDALKKAFPTKNELQRMVYYGLGQNLEEIASGNLEDIIFELMRWATARGRIVDLIDKAREHNNTNPELLQFYQEVWKSLVDAETATPPKHIAHIMTPIDTPLPDTGPSIDESTPLPISGDASSFPDLVDTTTELCPTESLRVCLLTHTKDVQESLQKAQRLFAQDYKIYLDRGQIACKSIKKKSDILHNVLSELLKIQQVDINLHTQFQIDKNHFWRTVEKVVLPIIEKSASQSALSYNMCQDMCTQLAALEQILASIDHQICEFCSRVDPNIDIYQFEFTKGKSMHPSDK